MNIKANNKEYNLEYTFEAALDKKCVDMCWNYFSGAYMMKGQALEGAEEKTLANAVTIDKMIDGMSDIPKMTVYLFYAGLLENHAEEIKSEEDAKVLLKAFRKENKEDERATFSGMLNAIRTQMEDDGFFKDIGLQEFMDNMKAKNQPEEQETPKAPKVPQDHKKSTKTSAN